ncbi:hypothetical protein GCM10009591_00160 [Brachybacterium tyrofermentans]
MFVIQVGARELAEWGSHASRKKPSTGGIMDRRKFFTATFVGAAAAEIGEEAVTVLQDILGVGGVVSACSL